MCVAVFVRLGLNCVKDIYTPNGCDDGGQESRECPTFSAGRRDECLHRFPEDLWRTNRISLGRSHALCIWLMRYSVFAQVLFDFN